MTDEALAKRARDLARWAKHWYDEACRQYDISSKSLGVESVEEQHTREYWSVKAHVLGNVLFLLGGWDEEFAKELERPIDNR